MAMFYSSFWLLAAHSGSRLASDQFEGMIQPPPLIHCQINPEHGEWLKQAGVSQGSHVHRIQPGFFDHRGN